MSISNENLATIIEEKLKAEGLIKESDTQFVNKLSKGTMNEVEWKLVLEAIINKPKPI